MNCYNMTKEQLKEAYNALNDRYLALKSQNLKLNMARGKPGADQLDLVSDILGLVLLLRLIYQLFRIM